MASNDLQRLVDYLALRDRLSDDERQTITELPHEMRTVRRNDLLVVDRASPKVSCILTRGFAARAVYLENGSRQITAIHVPGDFVDLHAFLLKIMDHSVVALTDCEAAFVPDDQLVMITEQKPHLARLLWMSTVIDAAIHRAWLSCIGRRSPAQHVAHLLCELYVRLNSIGLASDDAFDFPVTQSDLADMLGLSVVHVNKTLGQMRATGMFTWNGSRVEILDFARLADYADFDPVYLSLVRIPR